MLRPPNQTRNSKQVVNSLKCVFIEDACARWIMGRATDRINQPVSAYLRQNVYFDLVSPSVESIAFAHRFIGGDRLLFASDDPWVKPTVFTQLVDQMRITVGERRKIHNQNAQKLFGL